MTTPASAREQRIRERAYELWEQRQGAQHDAAYFWHQARADIAADEAAYDDSLEGSFPASDPPAHSGIT